MQGKAAPGDGVIAQHTGEAHPLLAAHVHPAHQVPPGHGSDALHAVLQLAHVAGPLAVEEHLQGLGAHLHAALVLPVEAGEEEIHQEGDVLAPLPQGRQEDGHHVDAEVEVGAELVLLHHLFQVAVGGGDEAHVHLVGPGAPHPLELLLLQHPQQLGLEGGRDVADLIQEQGAPVGQLEAPLALVGGAGEGALLVTEELGLQQGLGQGGTVELDEGAVPAAAQVVDGPGDDLLAGAGLAPQQDSGLARRGLVHIGEHLLHALAVADDVLQAVAPLEFLLQAELLLHQFLALRGHGAVQAHGLADEVGHHGEEAHVALEALAVRLPFPVHAEDAHGLAPYLDGHADESHLVARLQGAGTGAVEEKGFGVHVGHHGRHPRLDDAAAHPLPDEKAPAADLLLCEPGSRHHLQLAAFLHEAHHAAPHLKVGGKKVQDAPQGLAQIEGRVQHLADLVNGHQLDAAFGFAGQRHVWLRKAIVVSSLPAGTGPERQRLLSQGVRMASQKRTPVRGAGNRPVSRHGA